MKINNSEYGYYMGSDVILDSMYMEYFKGRGEANLIIEIFYSDVTYKMTMT